MSSFLDQQNQGVSLSLFRAQYDRKVIPQWLQAYIDYQVIQFYLTLIQDYYQYYHNQFFTKQQFRISMIEMEPESQRQVIEAVEYVTAAVGEGQEKVDKFVKWKLNQILYYWVQAIEVTLDYQLEEQATHENFDKKYYVKELLKTLYANTLCLRQFVQLNTQIKNHCQQALKDYAHPLLTPSYEHEEDVNASMLPELERVDSDFQLLRVNSTGTPSFDKSQEKTLQYLSTVERQVKRLYHSPFYFSGGAKSDLQDYVIITTKKHVSSKNYFLFGLYIGLGSIIFISLFLLLILDFVAFEQDDDQTGSITYMFPMFRGVGLLILYLWGMAWNVYGFIKYKVNFKLVLEYGSHYSNPYQIMKRAGFFTLIFSLMLFLYLVGLEVNKTRPNYVPIQYTPFAVWLIYFSYIFFPSKYVFNPTGRTYFYGVLKKMMRSPFVRMSFVLSFATDQAVSFVTPLKDLAYTVCFYGSDFSVREVKDCLKTDNFEGFLIIYVAAVIPLLLRMIQCYNQAVQSTGKFKGHIQMWNFLKYMASVFTSTFSFLNSFSVIKDHFFIPFVISSIISTSYSYYWDLKNDWGLLEKNSKHFMLRNHLSYKNPKIYYIAIVVNLLLRCSWTLTISPSVLILIPKSTFLPFITGFLQIFRRCMWNFFRIQKQHVANCQNFSIVKNQPSKLLGKIQAQSLTQSFTSTTHESVVQYTKVADYTYTEYLKHVVCKNLPEVQREDIQIAQKDFKIYQQSMAEEKMAKSLQIKKQLRAGKKDYFDI